MSKVDLKRNDKVQHTKLTQAMPYSFYVYSGAKAAQDISKVR
jgi:hypothetical protein